MSDCCLCEMGLRCPHLLRDDEGGMSCFYPHTAWTIDEDSRGVPTVDMCACDCPLVETGSRLYELLWHLDVDGDDKEYEEAVAMRKLQKAWGYLYEDEEGEQ